VSQQGLSVRDTKQILIDFTERKLVRYMKLITDPQQRQALRDLLRQYKKGEVAVAWKKGLPQYFNVTKEK
jgi:hypothetical protein